jgi:hypothetical protein
VAHNDVPLTMARNANQSRCACNRRRKQHKVFFVMNAGCAGDKGLRRSNDDDDNLPDATWKAGQPRHQPRQENKRSKAEQSAKA